jgi:hypothetical protein
MPSVTTPAQQGGTGAVRRWIALLDAAEVAIYQVDPADPVAQRSAGRRIESLFLFEHHMTPEARRLAREAIWRRDHRGKSLPGRLHQPTVAPAEPGCVCATCRVRWERCNCRACRLALIRERSSSRRPLTR